MKHSLSLAAMATLFALSACGGETTNTSVETGNEASENVATPVAMPPMIKESKIYRCKDNSVAYVDFINDDVTANLKSTKDGTPTILKAPAAGEAFVSGETSVAGNGAQVTIKFPGKSAQSCKAG